MIEFAEAIEQLGGQLTALQQHKREAVAAASTAWRQRRAGRDLEPERPLGRNDLCHCGSGKKYKRCHLAADEEAGRA